MKVKNFIDMLVKHDLDAEIYHRGYVNRNYMSGSGDPELRVMDDGKIYIEQVDEQELGD